MAGMTIDGLGSGLQTSSIISQLMQIEARPQATLKKKVTSENSVISAYQAVNTKMSALKTAAAALTTTSSWQAAKVTSSSTSVTATATAGAAAGSTTFDVKQLATTHIVTAVMPASAVTTAGKVDITIGTAAPVSINVTTDTPQGVADAINAKGIGVKASVVNTDQGTVLQLTAAKSGAANAFTISGLNATANTAVTGVDAQIAFGSGTAGAYTVSSSSNTFTGVLPNVTFTATAKQDGVTLTVGSDAESIADKMQAFVDSINGALSSITLGTAYNATTGVGGPLTGDYTVRQIQGNLLSGISTGKSGYGSFKKLGVELDSSGKLTFNRATFLAAYNADPAAVQGAIATGATAGTPAADGLADRFATMAKRATDFTTGSLTTAIQSHKDQVRDLTKRISDWDDRLTAKQAALQRQYSGLDTALGKMSNQSKWLAGQLAGLPTGTSSGQ